MKIRIITVGKMSDKHVSAHLQEYEKRLSRWTTVDWLFLPHGKSMDDESAAILKQTRPDDLVVLLDENGTQQTTPDMTKELDKWLQQGKQLTFIVGGAFGVGQDVIKRADYVWSFSKLVFPHQLMRVMLIEQVYRMFNLRSGGKYHHQ